MPAWKKRRMRAKALLSLLLLFLCCLPAGAAQGFADYVLAAMRAMPEGGGYAADPAAERRLAERGIVWDGRQLRVSPRGASPTFCSAACYMVLLQALQNWQAVPGHTRFSPRVWECLRVLGPRHPDGLLSWGRANANGPGFAKWVCDLGAGVNFSSVSLARPGDFLKFFHSPDIGVSERGHMVIFLGLESLKGVPHICYWSANKGQGYGIRRAPLRSLHHLIFTRITHPEAFARAPLLPQSDAWLGSMLTQPHSFDQVRKRCRIEN